MAQTRVRGAAVDLRHQVHQKLRLRAVVRRIAVDVEEAQQAVDQVVDGGREVGTFLLGASPAAEVKTIVLVFFQRRGIEYADHIIADAHRFHPFMPFARGAPVERIHVLQNGDDAVFRQLLSQDYGKMPGREMRLAKQHHDDCIGMALPDLGHFVGRMAIPRPDLAQIFPRHAVQSIDRLGVLARGHQQFVERRPVIAPVEVEANALPQLFRINLAPPPFVEDVLVAGKIVSRPSTTGRSPGWARSSSRVAAKRCAEGSAW